MVYWIKFGGIFMPKGITFPGEFKQKIVEDMRKHRLSYRETARKFGLPDHKMIIQWERIYLEKGSGGLFVDRRGRANADSGTQKGRKPKLDPKIEEDLIAENQRLRAEIDYLKKLNALVTERVQREKKHRS
jgi:transposase